MLNTISICNLENFSILWLEKQFILELKKAIMSLNAWLKIAIVKKLLEILIQGVEKISICISYQ